MMHSLATTPRSFGLGLCLGIGGLTSFACSTEDKTSGTTPPLMDAAIAPPDSPPPAQDSGQERAMDPDTGNMTPIDSGRRDANVTIPVPTNFTVTDQYIDLPCYYPGDIDVIGTQLFGTCTTGGGQAGDRNHIFRADLNSAARPIPSEAVVDLPEIAGVNLNQLISLSDSVAIVTANDRFYEVDLNAGTYQENNYPDGHNSGAGGIRLGDQFVMTTSNVDFVTFGYDPAGGGLFLYDVVNDGLDTASLSSFRTAGLNTTGVALLDSARILVVNSGEFSDTAEAVIDIVDVSQLPAGSSEAPLPTERSIRISNLTAQVAGEAAIFGNGNGQLSVLGSAAYSNTTPFAGELAFINVDTGASERMDVPGTLFHSSVKVDDTRQVAYVTDFNAGTVNVINLQERAVIQTLQVLSGEAGPSELYQGQLIQAGPYQAALVRPTP